MALYAEKENLLSEYQRTKRKVKQLSQSIVQNEQNIVNSKNNEDEESNKQTPDKCLQEIEVELEVEVEEGDGEGEEVGAKREFDSVELSEKLHQILASKEEQQEGLYTSLIHSSEHKHIHDKLVELLKLDHSKPSSNNKKSKSKLSSNYDTSSIWNETHENLTLSIQTAGLRIGRETALMKLTAELASIHNSTMNTKDQGIKFWCNHNHSYTTISFEIIVSLLHLLDDAIFTQKDANIKMDNTTSEKEQAIKGKNNIQKELFKIKEDWTIEKQDWINKNNDIKKKVKEDMNHKITIVKNELELIHYQELNQIRNELENEIKQKELLHEDTIHKHRIEKEILRKELIDNEETIASLKKKMNDLKEKCTESRQVQEDKEQEYIVERQATKQELEDNRKRISEMQGEFVAFEAEVKNQTKILKDEHKSELEDIEHKVKTIICSLEEKVQTMSKNAFDSETRARDAESLLFELDQSFMKVETVTYTSN